DHRRMYPFGRPGRGVATASLPDHKPLPRSSQRLNPSSRPGGFAGQSVAGRPMLGEGVSASQRSVVIGEWSVVDEDIGVCYLPPTSGDWEADTVDRITSTRGRVMSQFPPGRILVVPGEALDRLGRFQGFCGEADRYLDALLVPGVAQFRPR